MVSSFDIRKVIIVIVAVALVYWLLLPKPNTKPVGYARENPGNNEQTLSGQPTLHKTGGVKGTKTAAQHESEPDSHTHGIFVKNRATEKLKIDSLREQLRDYEADLEKAHYRIRELEMTIRESKNQVVAGKEVARSQTKRITFDGHRLVHLDLKGGPPKLEYLMRLIPLVKGLGATGFLIEYEDMFPFSGNLSILQKKNSYTEIQLKDFLGAVKEENLIVVPLIQTFGHLEYVLKHEKFSSLRENPKITNSVCPLNKKSGLLIKEMIKQIIDFHEDMEWIHLGGDEVWNLNSCEKCTSSGKSKPGLYLHHMTPLFSYVQKYSKGKTKPIIWDDMMRNWTLPDLEALAKTVELMVWGYVPDLSSYHKFSEGMWKRYTTAFKTIWFASSFKGALKPYSNFVPLRQHINNHISWLKIYSQLKEKIKIQGIGLTGWSRFDHYGPMCELLPPSIPSLAICLAILGNGEFTNNLHWQVSKRLGFVKPFQIDVPVFKYYNPEDATYPGHDVYVLVGKLERALNWYYFAEHLVNGWARPYQLKANRLSFFHLNSSIGALGKCVDSLREIKISATDVLNVYFSKDIVNEWVDDKILNTYKTAEKLKVRVQKIIKGSKF